MSKNLIFLGEYEDESFLPRLKSVCGSATVFPLLKQVNTLTEIEIAAKKKNITGIITDRVDVLKKLLNWPAAERKNPSLDNYQGSFFSRNGMEYVIVQKLDHLVKVNYASFIFKRYISKLADPESWPAATKFNWKLFDPATIKEDYDRFHSAIAIAVDIETATDPLRITEVGYCGIFSDSSGGLSTISIVFPVDSEYNLSWVRKFNQIPVRKIFQNGKYDNAYFFLWNSLPTHYFWDTQNLFHAWYSELPKDLAYLQAFFVRESRYWKDLAKSPDKMERYRYNALDIWSTANAWMQQILQAPSFAINNYLEEFPLIYPCFMAEMRGIKRDENKLKEVAENLTKKISERNAKLAKLTNTKEFNSNSPQQVKRLLSVLGCYDIESTEEKNLNKAAARHPINEKILSEILEVRGERKLVSTYLTTGEDSKEFKGRILFKLNPDGTDSGRLASREHHFWIGLQIQNIPRGKEVKQTIVADEGFLFAECDLKQAESRDTGYASGDERLIQTVESDKDFHSLNTSAFFGVPYETVWDDVSGKAKDKELRDLAKRVNHGANYCMGPQMMLDTMGIKKVRRAQKLLRLNPFLTPVQVCEYLLEIFHKTYPNLRKIYYPAIIAEVETTRRLTSRALFYCENEEEYTKRWNNGERDWVRYCFGHPAKVKSDMNSYVAHVAQSLNARMLNKAWLKIFYEVALRYPEHFKLCAQIHDSILFQFREGHEYLCDEVKKRMEIITTIRGYDGKIRTFVVPADIKAGKDGKGAKYWSDTE